VAVAVAVLTHGAHLVALQDTWNAVVQLRQKVAHKKTFYYLEQLIIKHRVHKDCINIKALKDGVDFYFSTRSHAKKLLDFLQACSPCKLKTSERLISADIHTSTYNYKFTLSVELVPICKGDVVCLHPALARKNGHISQLCICDHVGSMLRFIDPHTLKVAEISADAYWMKPFFAICSMAQLTEYMVLGVEPVEEHERRRGDADADGPVGGKYQLAEITLARVKDFGANDVQCVVRSHLGHVLQYGDLAWGFDLAGAVVNDEHANKLDASQVCYTHTHPPTAVLSPMCSRPLACTSPCSPRRSAPLGCFGLLFSFPRPSL
jgi:nonsense-mediated mRNA decay protein 3